MPTYYKGNALAMIGPEEDLVWPSYTEKLDYELEMGIIIGKGGRDIPAEQGEDHIFGYTALNDWSARDIQRREMACKLGPAKGKDFATSIGPCIATADEVDPYDLRMTARINGETWSDNRSGTSYWTFGQLIAHVSMGETIHPGELFGSGTVGGGCGLELDRWAAAGGRGGAGDRTDRRASESRRAEGASVPMRLREKVAIVTGAGSGIGRATAVRFAEEGADVAISEIDREGAEQTAESIRELGRRALVTQTDVSRSEAVQAAIAKTLDTFGRIDIVVNNAGINLYKFPNEFTDEDWHRVIGVNLNGVWFNCRYVLDHFLARGQGNIVNIASIGAFQASHLREPYMASKGGVVALTRTLAIDLADRNIRVNAVAPGMTETEMTSWRVGGDQYALGQYLAPMGRWGRPREVADAVLFLASDESSYITGHVLCVDGGMIAGNRIGRPFPTPPKTD